MATKPNLDLAIAGVASAATQAAIIFDQMVENKKAVALDQPFDAAQLEGLNKSQAMRLLIAHGWKDGKIAKVLSAHFGTDIRVQFVNNIRHKAVKAD